MSDPLLDVRIADAPPESPAVELPPLDEGPAGVRQLVEYLALRGLTGGLAALPASLLRPLEALLARGASRAEAGLCRDSCGAR